MNFQSSQSSQGSKAENPDGQLQDGRSGNNWTNVAPLFLKYHRWFLLFAGLLILVYQAMHIFIFHRDMPSTIWQALAGETFSVAVILFSISYLVRWLVLTIAQKNRLIEIMEIRHEFANHLSASQDIPDFAKNLIEQLASVFPFTKLKLFLHDQEKDWLIQVFHQENEKPALPADYFATGMSVDVCKACLIKNNQHLHALSACKRKDAALLIEDLDGFCLPLAHGGKAAGLLVLYSSPSKKIAPEQYETLKNLSNVIFFMLEMVIEKKKLEELRMVERLRSMQLDIARDLHDTVGQNIGFLRMKLDYLTEQNKEHQSDLVMEISSMSRVANESYDLMRGTLAVLQTQSSEDLLKLLSKYADQVADRSNIDISFSSEGIPLVFSPDRIRHIFYIFRESVSNIEKHAHASKVLVEFLWKKEELTITITDNGIGYDVSKTYRADAHFGVKFMRERASLLRGNLELVANPSGGTKVIVNIPAGI